MIEHQQLAVAKRNAGDGASAVGRPDRLDQQFGMVGHLHQTAAVGRGPARAGMGHPAMRLGVRVRHASFGEGVVLDAEGQGAHARVQVNFERAGTKWLVLAYAKLETV